MLTAIVSGEPVIAQEAVLPFDVQEKTITQIQQAIINKQITTQGVVEAYLRRVQAYNGTCVNEPQGILGPVTPIAHARQINALSTLNLRPAARAAWEFDARKARSLNDAVDDAENMPDALETAAAQDQQFARTRTTRRSAARRRHRDQGSVRHVRHAHDVRRGRRLRQRPAARRCNVREATARRGRDHPGEGEPCRVRGRRRAQFVRRHLLQPVRHRARARHVERRLGDSGRGEPRDVRNRRGNGRLGALACVGE